VSELKIESVEAIIVDLPLRRLQKFAAVGAGGTSVVLVRIRSNEGIEGVGEACTPSGPWWGGESVESIKTAIDLYIAPLVVGMDPFDLRGVSALVGRKLFGNAFAKAAVEMALLDIQGKAVGLPAHDLLGGKRRDSLRCSWPLATGDAGAEVEEAEAKIAARQFNAFKLKMGFLPPEKDVARARRVAQALEGRAAVRADPNESWDEATCKWALPRLEDAGVDFIEQPIARGLLGGLARIAARSKAAVMLDESICTETDALDALAVRAGDAVSLKPLKSGGLVSARRIADIALAGGMSVYMGTFLESSIGAAAGMQLAATLESLPFGGELSGPGLIAEDLAQQPARYENFALQLEPGPGLAVAVDEDKLRALRRDRKRGARKIAAV